MASSETCSRCGQEVRWGWRDGREGYWHREAVDHVPIFGHIQTEDERAEIERQLDLPREKFIPTKTGWPLLFDIVPYTTREADQAKMSKAARERAEEEDGGHVDVELPPMEIERHTVTADDFDPRSGIRRVFKVLTQAGWEITRFTASRGPYLGAKGNMLSVSDRVVLHGRGPTILDGSLDECHAVAVASWRDGGFDGGFGSLVNHTTKNATLEPLNATELATWIKENA